MKALNKIYVFFLILMMGSSCSENCPACDKGYEIIGSYAKEKNKRDGWSLDGLGGSFDDKIKEIFISFIKKDEADVDKARILIVDGIEELLRTINATSKIGQFLADQPFTYEDLEFGLAFHGDDGRFAQSTNIAYASLVDGQISYAVDTIDKLVTVHIEAYEEALKIVEAKKMVCRTEND